MYLSSKYCQVEGHLRQDLWESDPETEIVGRMFAEV